MALEFAEKLKRINVYPAADGYALGDEVALLASHESPHPPLPAARAATPGALAHPNRAPASGVPLLAPNGSPYPPIPEVREAILGALGDLNRYPDPSNAALRRKLS